MAINSNGNGNGNGNYSRQTDTIKTWGLVAGYILSVAGIIALPCISHPSGLLNDSEATLGQLVMISVSALAGLRATSELTNLIAVIIKLRQNGQSTNTPTVVPTPDPASPTAPTPTTTTS